MDAILTISLTRMYVHTVLDAALKLLSRWITSYTHTFTGSSLSPDDLEGADFSRGKFTIYPTDEFPIGTTCTIIFTRFSTRQQANASYIPTKPSSQQQRTRDLPVKGRIFSRQHPQQSSSQLPLSTENSANACLFSKVVSFLSIFKNNIMEM